MSRGAFMFKRFSCGLMPLLLTACASAQLNYNALDLASASSDLLTSQVLSNLSRTKSFAYAIPSQVAIPSGSVTTTNSITPNISGPLGLSATNELATTVAATISGTTTRTTVTPNGSIGADATDQWSQNWSLTTLQDPGQMLRLRALYRFGAGQTTRKELLCEYPLVQNTQGAQGSGQTSTQTTVNVNINGQRTTFKTPTSAVAVKYKLKDNCPSNDPGTPDPSLLKPPECVICDYCPKSTADNPNRILRVNDLLFNDWAIFWPGEQAPGDNIPMGHFGKYDIYVKKDKQEHYSDFVILVLAATQLSSSSSSSSPQKIQTPAAATLLAE